MDDKKTTTVETKPSTDSPKIEPAVKRQEPESKPVKKTPWLRIVIGLVLLGLGLVFGVPWLIHSFNIVSTDDAYVNGYVTFVAPRVKGQVLKVLVEDNNRVKKGDVLVELDPEPYQVVVSQKQAAVDLAQADLIAAQATARGMVAEARSQRFALVHAIEAVDNQVALLRQRVAKWEETKANLVLAQSEFDRASSLVASHAISAQDLDQRSASLDVAKAQVTQALEDVYQARVGLGLPGPVADGKSLTDVPADIDQTYSSVRQALSDLLHSAAQLGIVPSSYDMTPKQTVDEFYRRDPEGNIDRIYEHILKEAPSVKQAEASVSSAQRDLDQANLDLKYCTVVAEIDGVITRRNVNPGNNVQAGQNLMALRSLRDIWIDANFKETQLRLLRIGQRVDLTTDLYGTTEKFEGRISGFTMGTGSTLALLPAQNATGNFVKVVQRLPVRIEIPNYDPDKITLFTGLSVTPEVDITDPPTGLNAGKFLQEQRDAAPNFSVNH